MSNGTLWTDEQKAEALAIYVDSGPAAAGRLTGIPSGTIASWAARTPGLQRMHAERTAAATIAFQEQAALLWSETKAELVTTLAGLATSFAHAVHDALESGNLRNAKEGMLALAIATDKAQLLTGGATGRQEHEVTAKVRADMLGTGKTKIMELTPPSRAKDEQKAS